MNQIKLYRERMKLSQAYIAERLDLSQQAVSQWETGERLPRADKLPQLAAILGCTIDELLCVSTKK